jgi:hypothetical protein
MAPVESVPTTCSVEKRRARGTGIDVPDQIRS